MVESGNRLSIGLIKKGGVAQWLRPWVVKKSVPFNHGKVSGSIPLSHAINKPNTYTLGVNMYMIDFMYVPGGYSHRKVVKNGRKMKRDSSVCLQNISAICLLTSKHFQCILVAIFPKLITGKVILP